MFPDENDKMVSVADYFRTKYQVELDPNLPLLCTRRPDPNNEDPMKRSGVYFPVEICVIAGQQRKSRLEASDVQELLKSNCLIPQDRMEQTVAYAKVVSEFKIVEENGVTVDKDPIRVVGEVLAPAHLRLGPGGRIKEKTLQPTFDFRDAHFYKPATITGWNIVCLDHNFRLSEVEQAMTVIFPRVFNMLNVKFPSRPSQVVEDIAALKLMPEDKV